MSCRESLRRHISYFGTLRLIRGSLGVVLGGGCIGGVSRRAGGVGWRDLLGRVCPKRRRLELRWRGYLQETVRWPGVFVVFSLCFRCASVLRCMMSGLISSVLDTWRTHCAAQTPEQGHPRSGPSWGGCASIVVDEGLRRQCGLQGRSRRPALIVRDETGVEGGGPR